MNKNKILELAEKNSEFRKTLVAKCKTASFTLKDTDMEKKILLSAKHNSRNQGNAKRAIAAAFSEYLETVNDQIRDEFKSSERHLIKALEKHWNK
jgi:hypothetical protein